MIQTWKLSTKLTHNFLFKWNYYLLDNCIKSHSIRLQLSKSDLLPTINVLTINYYERSTDAPPAPTAFNRLSFASISIKKFTLNVESVNIVFG